MMNCEMMRIERRLYEVSLKGDITSLMELLEEDPLILERMITSFTETPLHIAAMFGHINFAKELLRRKPDLTFELDSHGFSPLHLAASRKDADMVKVLLAANPNVCRITDKEGRTPLHVAAMKGRIETMKELINTCSVAIQVVADRGETILHLCVKHNRLEALKLLFEVLNSSNGGVRGDSSSSSSTSMISINSKDGNGNTILHLAVAEKHWEMINVLLNKSNNSTKGILEVNALNKNGFTPLDVLIIQSARDLKDIEIRELLSDAGCVRASSFLANNVYVSPLQAEQQIPQTVPTPNIDNKDERFAKWLESTRNSLMVVASLIATMAFQTGLSPPGGFWDSDGELVLLDGQPVLLPNGEYLLSHHSGKAILAAEAGTYLGYQYSAFVFYNTTGFLASLSIILLLISGLPLRQRFFVWFLVVIMWIAITSMALSYSVTLTIAREDGSRAAVYGIFGWLGLLCLVVVLHFCRLIRRCCIKNRPMNYARMRPMSA